MESDVWFRTLDPRTTHALLSVPSGSRQISCKTCLVLHPDGERPTHSGTSFITRGFHLYTLRQTLVG